MFLRTKIDVGDASARRPLFIAPGVAAMKAADREKQIREAEELLSDFRLRVRFRQRALLRALS